MTNNGPNRDWRSGALHRIKARNDEAYLLSTPSNAARLHEALEGARKGTGAPMAIQDLRAQYSLDPKPGARPGIAE